MWFLIKVDLSGVHPYSWVEVKYRGLLFISHSHLNMIIIVTCLKLLLTVFESAFVHYSITSRCNACLPFTEWAFHHFLQSGWYAGSMVTNKLYFGALNFWTKKLNWECSFCYRHACHHEGILMQCLYSLNKLGTATIKNYTIH